MITILTLTVVLLAGHAATHAAERAKVAHQRRAYSNAVALLTSDLVYADRNPTPIAPRLAKHTINRHRICTEAGRPDLAHALYGTWP